MREPTHFNSHLAVKECKIHWITVRYHLMTTHSDRVDSCLSTVENARCYSTFELEYLDVVAHPSMSATECESLL